MLYIISTPIGNLRDITLRALDTLKEVDFIICEDTRVTSILLNHFEIKKELVALNAANEERKIEPLISRIKNGEKAGIVSDAGTPSISDPGVRLISAAIKNEINIIPIPGATAFVTALSISGLPSDDVRFVGFLPQKKGRQKTLEELSRFENTVVLYESVYRIERLIKELNEFMPKRLIAVCRELTKKFEEVWRGHPEEILNDLPNKNIKGEFVVVISPIGWQ